MDSYDPRLPLVAWDRISDFVRQVTTEITGQVPYTDSAVLNAVAYHVDWCVNLAGFTLDRDDIFCREVIGAAVAAMPTAHSSSKGRRRSILFRVGETLGAIPVPPPLPPLAAAAATAPYSASEVDQLRLWAATQGSRDEPSARALVALGLGAGLATRDIGRVSANNITDHGALVQITGPEARFVPVSDPWGDELADLAAQAEIPNAPLFRPGVAWSKNVITVFVARSARTGMRPSTQRMRATWLVQHLMVGTPMQDLLSAAGLTSMDALVRYEKFLPPAAPPARTNT
ncbi:hypothetical protein [Microbacterium oleivorans]|uniref:Tyr recombinase domain-containing protein n=1 Tax=Microbacterium oleivorans TaxID=273677 RepID=A0A4R5YIW7_9MICO|nr:hypothetical protein [Microbacterium oleivorans]TDL45284.1 hypothetical protein E2R54_02130 [Microbacterium oleivorans]